MSSPRSFLAALGCALVVCACAPQREFGYDGRPVYRASDVDSAPRLLGCSDYDPTQAARLRGAPGGALRMADVRVSYIVDANGSVEPASVMVASAWDDPTVATRAAAIARGCTFVPGTLRDRTVSVRLATVFRVERTAP